MKYTILLDNGHGGMVDGKYSTCPDWTDNPKTWHKMHVHEGVPLYEGVFNRDVVDEIAAELWKRDIKYVLINPESKDISLKERVKRANDFYKDNKNCIFVSIHGNAFNTSAKGFEIFTSKGDTPADPIAESISIEMSKAFPSRVMRWDLSDGDRDKEANFYVLKHTDMPAILSENFFFDNPSDAKLMMSERGIEKIALAHVEGIIKALKN